LEFCFFWIAESVFGVASHLRAIGDARAHYTMVLRS